MTPLMKKMIADIAESEYSEVNGRKPEELAEIGWIWADCIIEDAADKGVFTNLVTAGYAKHSGNKGRDAAVTLTEAGFAEYTKD